MNKALPKIKENEAELPELIKSEPQIKRPDRLRALYPVVTKQASSRSPLGQLLNNRQLSKIVRESFLTPSRENAKPPSSFRLWPELFVKGPIFPHGFRYHRKLSPVPPDI